MKAPLNWVESTFEENGDVRTWTHIAGVPGGWLVRVTTYVKTKYGGVAASQCMEYVPGILEHAPVKAKPLK